MMNLPKLSRTKPIYGKPSAPGHGCKKRSLLPLVMLLLLAGAAAWGGVRFFSSVECTRWKGAAESGYPESEKVFAAMSLSCLAYGCESCEEVGGTVTDILATQKMGIILENADILRTDPTDPATALIDSAAFIRQTVGDYRFLTEMRDSKSGFYGAAFADDENRTVWVSYSGSVSLQDAAQSVMLVLGAGLSGQEKQAFRLYEAVLNTDEIQDGYSLILTGHSLGGALAAAVSRVSGAQAVTVSGADGLAVRKINGILGEKSAEYRIGNYLTSPESRGFSFLNCIQKIMLWGEYEGIACHIYPDNKMTENTHCIFSFVRFEDGDLSRPLLPAE